MDKPYFEAEVIFVYLVGPSASGVGTPTLRHATLEEVNGHTFVCGSIITTDNTHWAAGRKCHIPLSNVHSIIEAGTYAEYMERRRKRPPPTTPN